MWAVNYIVARSAPGVVEPHMLALAGAILVVIVRSELWPAWSWRATWLTVAVALAPGLSAYWIYGWSQKILGASRVAMTLYLGPLYAALAAWWVLGEPLGWHHLGGAAMILPGVFLVMRASGKA